MNNKSNNKNKSQRIDRPRDNRKKNAIPDTDEIKAILASPNGTEKLFLKYDTALVMDAVFTLAFSERYPAAMAYLCRACKTASSRAYVNERLTHSSREALHACINDSEPKLRKNAARLTGLLLSPEDVGALVHALNKEKTMFVIPSQILALGALAKINDEARSSLLAFKPPETGDSTLARLNEDIVQALKTAREPFVARERHEFRALPYKWDIELVHADNLGDGLLDEIRRTGVNHSVISRGKSSVTINTDDYVSLFNVRLFSEALFVLGEVETLSGEDIAEVAAPALRRLMRSHTGSAPYHYRIEIKLSDTDRAALSKAIARVLDADGTFQNSVSAYEIELRIKRRSDGGAFLLYAKLFTLPDRRFSYRVADIPASISPSTAAAIIAQGVRYSSFNRTGSGAYGPRVLDICCGSGTLLFERERSGALESPGYLLGLDISERAIAAARRNREAAGSGAEFLRMDCIDFVPKEGFDEVVSNLPFGSRVGSHSENRELYFGIAGRLAEWLKPSGAALLYTTEKRLMREAIRRESAKLLLIDEVRTESGGLSPSLFVVGVREGLPSAGEGMRGAASRSERRTSPAPRR